MAGFTELIKNFDKIRDYARDFLVYGYKCRNDYTRKSSRSYDNERRRIESYLAGYIHWETSARGKNLFISTDTGDLSQNPLFSVWETKSFTANDCLLHFCLFVYRIEVSDTQEMVPWLRTFIGRIISITGSNQRIIKQFRDDIERMAHMYEN